MRNCYDIKDHIRFLSDRRDELKRISERGSDALKMLDHFIQTLDDYNKNTSFIYRDYSIEDYLSELKGESGHVSYFFNDVINGLVDRLSQLIELLKSHIMYTNNK